MAAQLTELTEELSHVVLENPLKVEDEQSQGIHNEKSRNDQTEVDQQEANTNSNPNIPDLKVFSENIVIDSGIGTTFDLPKLSLEEQKAVINRLKIDLSVEISDESATWEKWIRFHKEIYVTFNLLGVLFRVKEAVGNYFKSLETAEGKTSEDENSSASIIDPQPSLDAESDVQSQKCSDVTVNDTCLLEASNKSYSTDPTEEVFKEKKLVDEKENSVDESVKACYNLVMSGMKEHLANHEQDWESYVKFCNEFFTTGDHHLPQSSEESSKVENPVSSMSLEDLCQIIDSFKCDTMSYINNPEELIATNVIERWLLMDESVDQFVKSCAEEERESSVEIITQKLKTFNEEVGDLLLNHAIGREFATFFRCSTKAVFKEYIKFLVIEEKKKDENVTN